MERSKEKELEILEKLRKVGFWQGSLNGTHVGGSFPMQTHGDFDGFPTYMCIVWVGNIVTHVWMREVVRKIAWQ